MDYASIVKKHIGDHRAPVISDMSTMLPYVHYTVFPYRQGERLIFQRTPPDNLVHGRRDTVDGVPGQWVSTGNYSDRLRSWDYDQWKQANASALEANPKCKSPGDRTAQYWQDMLKNWHTAQGDGSCVFLVAVYGCTDASGWPIHGFEYFLFRPGPLKVGE